MFCYNLCTYFINLSRMSKFKHPHILENMLSQCDKHLTLLVRWYNWLYILNGRRLFCFPFYQNILVQEDSAQVPLKATTILNDNLAIYYNL